MTQTTPQPYALKFWYKPGTVVRALIEAGQGHGFALFVAVAFGIVQAGPFYLAPEHPRISMLLAGAVLGFCGLYLFSWLLRNFGRWFGSEAKLAEVRTALGLGLLPWVLLFAGFMPTLVAGSDAAAAARFFPVFVVGLVYGYVVLLLSLSAALRISVLKTFLCLVVTLLVSLFPLTFVGQLLYNAFSVAP